MTKIKFSITKLLTVLFAVFLMVAITSCGAKSNNNDSKKEIANKYERTDMFKIEMENGGIIEGELYPDLAPITVANFEKLAKKGFYDGLIFHRIIDGFMIQGGDPEGTGMGGSDETIKGEFSENGVENDLKHEQGVLSMARSDDMDSASSQFFIMLADTTHLDGKYAAFGKVTSGMDIVLKIGKTKTAEGDVPIKKQIIKKITIS